MLNKAQLIGHIGKEPKITTTESGYTIANFSVATTERGYTSKDGKQIPDRTEWHNVVCYGKLAEIVKNYAEKGAKVYVEGKMRTRKYEDRDGINRSIVEIHADQINIITRPQHNDQQQARPKAEYNLFGNSNSDDVPF